MSEGDKQPSPHSMHCLTCDYDLRSLSDNRCPECGRWFDPHDPASYGPSKELDREFRGFQASLGLALILVALAIPPLLSVVTHHGGVFLLCPIIGLPGVMILLRRPKR